MLQQTPLKTPILLRVNSTLTEECPKPSEFLDGERGALVKGDFRDVVDEQVQLGFSTSDPLLERCTTPQAQINEPSQPSPVAPKTRLIMKIGQRFG